jgi:hypothetical protein
MSKQSYINKTEEDMMDKYVEQLLLADISYIDFNIEKDNNYNKKIKGQFVKRGIPASRMNYVLKTYDIEQHTDPDSGASFTVFTNHNNPKAPKILAIRGTEDYTDIKEDVAMMRDGIPTDQTEYVRRKLIYDMPPAVYEVVGQSLGASVGRTLAEVLPNHMVKSVLGYNSPGVDLETPEAERYIRDVRKTGHYLDKFGINGSAIKNLVAAHNIDAVANLFPLENVVQIPGDKHNANRGWDTIYTLKKIGAKDDNDLKYITKNYSHNEYVRLRESIKDENHIYYEQTPIQMALGIYPNDPYGQTFSEKMLGIFPDWAVRAWNRIDMDIRKGTQPLDLKRVIKQPLVNMVRDDVKRAVRTLSTEKSRDKYIDNVIWNRPPLPEHQMSAVDNYKAHPSFSYPGGVNDPEYIAKYGDFYGSRKENPEVTSESYSPYSPVMQKLINEHKDYFNTNSNTSGGYEYTPSMQFKPRGILTHRPAPVPPVIPPVVPPIQPMPSVLPMGFEEQQAVEEKKTPNPAYQMPNIWW